MSKWIQAGYLPAIPLEKGDEGPVENRTQLFGLIENQLLEMFREEIDPELSQEENLEELTETAKAMLSELRSNGLAEWADADAIAREALGMGNAGAIQDMLQDESLETKIMMWLTWKDEGFPLKPRKEEDVEEHIRTDPVSWAESIAQDW